MHGEGINVCQPPGGTIFTINSLLLLLNNSSSNLYDLQQDTDNDMISKTSIKLISNTLFYADVADIIDPHGEEGRSPRGVLPSRGYQTKSRDSRA